MDEKELFCFFSTVPHLILLAAIVIHFWHGFLCHIILIVLMIHSTCSAAAPVPSSEKKDSAKPVESKPQSASAGLEDLFKDSPPVPLSSGPAVSQANVKNDIMSLFEKVSSRPPFMTNVCGEWFYCQKKDAIMVF
jgi:hypothetical protein